MSWQRSTPPIALAAFSGLVGLLVGQPSARAQTPLEEILRQASPAVVTILAYDAQGEPVDFGSGFVVEGDGWIVSSYELVRRAKSLKVLDEAGKELLRPEVVWLGESLGFALLRVAAELPPVLLGNSDTARVGDEVVAMGCPVGFERTVVRGRISDRAEEGPRPLLHTTLPRAPGSEGGPLFNRVGEVIGLTLGHHARSASRVLPINQLRRALADVSSYR